MQRLCRRPMIEHDPEGERHRQGKEERCHQHQPGRAQPRHRQPFHRDEEAGEEDELPGEGVEEPAGAGPGIARQVQALRPDQRVEQCGKEEGQAAMQAPPRSVTAGAPILELESDAGEASRIKVRRALRRARRTPRQQRTTWTSTTMMIYDDMKARGMKAMEDLKVMEEALKAPMNQTMGRIPESVCSSF